MALTYLALASVTVANGETTVTVTGVDLTGVAYAGDYLALAPGRSDGVRIAADAVGSTFELEVPWPAASLTDDPAELQFERDSVRNSERTRRLQDKLGELAAIGLQPNAIGSGDDRDEYDGKTAGFIYLGLDDPWVLSTKATDADGDWSEQPVAVAGPPGENVAWLTGAGVPSGGTGSDGDMYLRANGEVYGPKAAGVWGAPVANLVGPAGDDGDPGADGTDPGVLMTWDDGTADADPGAGNIRASHATWASASFLYISKTNRAGNSIAAYLAALDDSTSNPKGRLILTRTGGNAQGGANVTGITDAANYVKVAITAHWGTSFIDGNAVSLQFHATGDAGAGAGDMVGPAGAVNDRFAVFDGTTGKLVKDGGIGVGDVYTKSQTDTLVANAAAGVGKRGTVRAATTGNVTIATDLNAGDSVDGVTLATGDLVLVKNQSAAEQNGVYVAGASPARSSEYDTYNEHPGSLLIIQEGTVNADTFWYCTSNAGGTLNTTAIVFAQLALTPPDDSVTNAKMANMADGTFKMRAAGAGSGDPIDGTPAQARAALGANRLIAAFSALHNQPPASNYATLDTRNSRPVLDFDTTTQETAIFSFVMPADYNGAGLVVTIDAALTSATSGTLGWDAAFETAASLDIDADSFATAKTGTAATVPATSGVSMRHTISFSNSEIDGLAAGDVARLRIRRDVANDNATGDAELIAVKVECA